MTLTSRALLTALLLLAVAAPTAAANKVGPDFVSSDNVDLVNRIRTTGDGVGGRIVGDYLYVTSTKGLQIFDIKSDPANPKLMGTETFDLEFENEEVPTNGKLLGISGQIGCADPSKMNVFNETDDGTGAGSNGTGCMTLYDVSDPTAVKRLTSVTGAGEHTATCLFDCQYFWGSAGAVTDARNPAEAKLVGDWQKDLPNLYKDPETGEESKFASSCHHVREIQPGIVLGSCQPMVVLSARAEDGGSPTKPVVLATGANQDNRFIHSSRWPNAGGDRFMLSGGETNASGTCDDTVGAFMVWDAGAVADGKGFFNRGAQFSLLSELRPQNGTYADGRSAYNGLGCSVHWFTEHPTFRNGGVVSLAMYENGTHFLQITPSGKIVDQGFFLPLAGSTSSPFWNPHDPTIVYSIDYERGVDVLKYTGSTYVPDPSGAVQSQPGATPGLADQGQTAGSAGAGCHHGSGFNDVAASGSGRNLRLSADLNEGTRYDVTLYEASRGRTVRAKARRLAGFRNRSGAITLRGRGLRDGFFLARFTTRLRDGHADTRTLALERRNGRFRAVPDFAQRTPCGAFSRLALSGPAFGGRAGRSLSLGYTLERAASQVTITVRVGGRLVRTIQGGGRSGRAYRYRLPASLARRGQTLRVTVTATRAGTASAQTVYAKRL